MGPLQASLPSAHVLGPMLPPEANRDVLVTHRTFSSTSGWSRALLGRGFGLGRGGLRGAGGHFPEQEWDWD